MTPLNSQKRSDKISSDINYTNAFLGQASRAIEINKNTQMGLNETYKLLHSEGNHEQMKRQSTEWEKIFANDVTNRGLISKAYKQLIQLNNNNNKMT